MYSVHIHVHVLHAYYNMFFTFVISFFLFSFRTLFSGAIVECPGILYSPLHYASEAGHVNIVQLLMDNKANSLRKTQLGKSPYQLAFENNHSDVMYVLQRTLPPPERPYQIEYSVKLPSDQVVASISFIGDSDKLITGSWDGFVSKIVHFMCIIIMLMFNIKLLRMISSKMYLYMSFSYRLDYGV